MSAPPESAPHLPLHARFRKIKITSTQLGNHIEYGDEDLLVIHAPDFHGPNWREAAFNELDTIVQLTAERMAWVFGHALAVFYGDEAVHTYHTGTFRSYRRGDYRRTRDEIERETASAIHEIHGMPGEAEPEDEAVAS